jgi:23S rRNA pseudouridine2604 synthase
MVTLKLKKPPGKAAPAQADRAPVRGTGAGVKKRPTLAEAQALRAEREARYQEQLKQRYGDRPPSGAKEGGAQRPRRDDRNPAPDARRRAPDSQQRDARGPRDATRGNDSRDSRPPRDARDARDTRGQPLRQDRRPPAPAHVPSGPNTAFGARPQRPARAPDANEPRRDVRQRPAENFQPQSPAPRRDDRRRIAAPDPRMHARPQRRGRDDDDDDDDAHATQQPGSMRLSKRMSELGIASRREADEWIPKGWVRVDGRVVKELGSRVLPGQHISIEAKARNAQAMKVTVLINKPVGYVSGQAEDGYEPASVLVKPENQWREDRSGIRFLPMHLRGLAPAGRLDIDSVGLLVLTQDGRIAKQLIGEDSEIDKEYLVRVHTLNNEPLPDSDLALLNHGLELDGEALRPATVEWVNDDQLRFVLREGKKRQIRRMCEAVGLEVLGLKRVRIGNVMLGDLPSGHWRYLRGDEKFGTAAPGIVAPEVDTPAE